MKLSELALKIRDLDRYRLVPPIEVSKIQSEELKGMLEVYYNSRDSVERLVACISNSIGVTNRRLLLMSRKDAQDLVNSDPNLAVDDPLKASKTKKGKPSKDGLALQSGQAWRGAINCLSSRLGMTIVLAESSSVGGGHGKGRPGIWLVNESDLFPNLEVYNDLDFVNVCVRALLVSQKGKKRLVLERVKEGRPHFDLLVKALLTRALHLDEKDSSSIPKLLDLYHRSVCSLEHLSVNSSDIYRSSYFRSFINYLSVSHLSVNHLPCEPAVNQPRNSLEVAVKDESPITETYEFEPGMEVIAIDNGFSYRGIDKGKRLIIKSINGDGTLNFEGYDGEAFQPRYFNVVEF